MATLPNLIFRRVSRGVVMFAILGWAAAPLVPAAELKPAIAATVVPAVPALAAPAQAATPPVPPPVTPPPVPPTASAPAVPAPAPEELYRLAEGLLSRDFHDLARQEFQRFLECYPEHALAPQAMLGLAESRRAEGKTTEALDVLDNFRRRWPNHEKAAAAALLKGEVLLEQGRTADAEAYFRELQANGPTAAREAAAYSLAREWVRQDKLPAARDAFAKLAALPLDPACPFRAHALFGLAAIAQKQGDLEAAAVAYRKLADEPKVPPALREESLYRLGELAFWRGDYAAATAAYGRQLTEHPNGPLAVAAAKRRAWAEFNRGDHAAALAAVQVWRTRFGDADDPEMAYLNAAALAGAGRLPEALDAIHALLTNTALTGDFRRLTRYQEAWCLWRLERFPETVSCTRAFLTDFAGAPETADIRFFLGDSLLRQNDATGGLAELRAAVTAAGPGWPFAPLAAERLAGNLAAAGQTAAAAAAFRDLARKAAPAKRPELLLRAGQLARRAGDAEAAIADLQQVRRDYPADVAASRAAALELVELYAETRRYPQAEALLQELQKQGGGDPAALRVFAGFLRVAREDYAGAEQQLRALLAEPGLPPAAAGASRFYLAVALLEQHRDPEALELFAALLQAPENARPVFSDTLLLRLEQTFFDHGRDADSEMICRLLLARGAGREAAVSARLRLARLLVARQQVAAADQAVEALLALPAAAPGQPGLTPAQRAEALVLGGELDLLANRRDRSVTRFQDCLRLPESRGEPATRARIGLAELFRAEKHPDQALQQAVSAFVLGDDPRYTPKAMLLAAVILLEQHKTAEAATTWSELEQRYPAFAGAHRADAALAPLFKKPAPPAGR